MGIIKNSILPSQNGLVWACRIAVKLNRGAYEITPVILKYVHTARIIVAGIKAL